MSLADLPTELTPRLTLTPVAAGSLARACKSLWAAVANTVMFSRLGTRGRDAFITNGYYICDAPDFGDPSKRCDFESDGDTDSDDSDVVPCDGDGEDEQGYESLVGEHAPLFVAVFEYIDDIERILGIHHWAVKYVDVPTRQYHSTVYVSNYCRAQDIGNYRRACTVFFMSNNYIALYA